jgi:hypothetical protein
VVHRAAELVSRMDGACVHRTHHGACVHHACGA